MFVRTKDAVYEVLNTITYGDKKSYIVGQGMIILEYRVLKQADTIEELCDEIVIRHLTSKKPYIADEYQKTQILKDRQKAFVEYGVEEVKGAIFTDKGLIYVAKMNDKGELELI